MNVFFYIFLFITLTGCSTFQKDIRYADCASQRSPSSVICKQLFSQKIFGKVHIAEDQVYAAFEEIKKTWGDQNNGNIYNYYQRTFDFFFKNSKGKFFGTAAEKKSCFRKLRSNLTIEGNSTFAVATLTKKK